ncbi:hypothetical protein AURDEDRAFT_176070 [Auricularia subglabra TFB-10046 SS5]|nr:hypothetical protein AURDEDRAFT_176070 [Auricularia subglabra TFB-10046 SS5]
MFSDVEGSATAAEEIHSRPARRLPPELTLQIMQQLSQNELRSASQASRDFYHLALAAGLYIHRPVLWSSVCGFGDTLATFAQVLDHAQRTPALNISLYARFSSSLEMYAAGEGALQEFAVSVQRALPYLVRLRLVFPSSVPGAIYTALCGNPAPRLRELTIDHWTDVSLPCDLFEGDAPMLCYVSLSLANVELMPVAVFQRVTHLRLSVPEPTRPVRLARAFPALQALALESPRSRAARGRKIDLSGLCLRYLALADGTESVDDKAALQAIPVIEHLANSIETVHWPARCDAICAHAELHAERGGSLSFGPHDGAWRRTVALKTIPNPLPLSDVPILASKLVSLTLDKSLISAFFQAPVALTALRELFLDISSDGSYCWPCADEFDKLEPSVHCPALARLVIFAIPSGCPVTVAPTKVASLARSLSLSGLRPALTLAGCTFVAEPKLAAIDELFAAVDVVELPGARIPQYYHTCRYSGYFTEPEWERLDA